MTDPFIELLARQFDLDGEDRTLLSMSELEMSRRQRRHYNRRLKPKLSALRNHLQNVFKSKTLSGDTEPEEWASRVAGNIVRKGYAGIVDRLLMDIIGRKRVSDLVKVLKTSGR